MSSVPYSGNIAYNLSTSLLLGTCSALSALAWWDRQPAVGQEPNLIQRSFTVSDNAPGAVAIGSALTGVLAADMFARGVAAPLYGKAKSAVLQSVEWVKNYRFSCRADGCAAIAATVAGAAALGTSFATDSTVGMVVGLIPVVAGPLYLNSTMGQGAIEQPPAPVLPRALGAIRPVETVEITPEHPLHVDAPYRMKYSGMEHIKFSSVGAAFVGRMMKAEYMKSENGDLFLEQPGDKLRAGLPNLSANELTDGYQLDHPDAYNNYTKLMRKTLDVKFGIGTSKNKLSKQQKEFRDELKKTCGNLRHPAIGTGKSGDPGYQVLISELRMTSMLKDLYDDVMEEDRKAAEPPEYSSSFGGVTGRSSNMFAPRNRVDMDLDRY